MINKIYVLPLIAVIAIVLGLGFTGMGSTGNIVANGDKIVIYKSASCGCCSGHASYLISKGFNVEIIEKNDISSIKTSYGVPMNMRSCHTAVIGDYFVEGHVPIEAINKLLEEKPEIDGIALPNMPAGSPGMPGVKTGIWIIYAISDGQVTEFMNI